MSAKHDLSIGQDLPQTLVSSLREGRVVLFLGAGASVGAVHPVNSPVPKGAELGRLLAEKFLGTSYADRPLAHIAELAISESDLVTVQGFIADLFRLFDPTPFHKQLALLPWKAIYSTNYDLIIERAYQQVGSRELVPFLQDGQRIDERLTSTRSLAYVKLHGCITSIEDPNVPLILTPDQYITHKKGRRRLFSRLLEHAYEYPLLFVGHSLADHDIRTILLELDELKDARPMSYIAAPSLTDVDERFWQNRHFTTLQATLESLVEKLTTAIPAAVAAVIPEVYDKAHPLRPHLKTNSPLPESLRTFVDETCTLVHANLKVKNADPAAFYRGHFGDWSPIAHNLDFSRTLLETLLLNVVLPEEDEREATQELVIISGHAGSGKSVLLHRLAWDAATEHNALCLFTNHYPNVEIEHLHELHRLTGKRIFLFIDRAAANREVVLDVLRTARQRRVPLTIVTAERQHSLNTHGEALLHEATQSFELRNLNRDEIEALLERLEKHKALGHLEHASYDERVREFQEHAGRQLLVALHEATLGKPFEEIVADEYRSIPSPVAQALYRTVALTHRLGVPIRAGLISRVHQISISAFKERFLEPLADIIYCRKDGPHGDIVYETRHPVVAQFVFETSLINPFDRHDEYVRVLSALDVDFAADREALRGLTRAKDLEDLFADKSLALNVVQTARARAPADARLVQQEALIEMNWPGSNLKRAETLLREATKLAEHDALIKHSLAELTFKKSQATSNPLEKQHLRKAARLACSELLSKPKRTSHPYHTLLKISLDELQEIVDQQADVALEERVKEVEQLLERARNHFPNDAHIIEAEANLSEFLNHTPKVLEALTRAFKANNRSPYIAVRLATSLADHNQLDEAVAVLKTCLDSRPQDGALHYQLALLLMDPHQRVTHEVLYHLRRSFTRGDAQWARQFWYARAEFILGNKEDALRTFAELSRVDLPHQVRLSPKGHVRDESGRPTRLSGRVEVLFPHYGFIIRDSDQAKLFFRPDWCERTVWQTLRKQNRVAFTVAFNYRGPVAVDVSREGASPKG